MKYLLIIIFSILLKFNYAQVSGTIAFDKRPIIQDIEYKITGTKSGFIFFNISVDESGKIISCTVDKAQTTVPSTPSKVKARNLITSTLKFKASSSYPKFHLGIVKISVVKPIKN